MTLRLEYEQFYFESTASFAEKIWENRTENTVDFAEIDKL